MDPIRICIFLTVLTLFLNLSQTWLDSLGCFARILSVRTEFSSNPLTNVWFRKVYINNLLVWQVKIEKYFICFLAKWSWQVYPGFRASDTIINLKNLLLRGFSQKKLDWYLTAHFLSTTFCLSDESEMRYEFLNISYGLKFTSLFIEARYLGCKEARYRKYA